MCCIRKRSFVGCVHVSFWLDEPNHEGECKNKVMGINLPCFFFFFFNDRTFLALPFKVSIFIALK